MIKLCNNDRQQFLPTFHVFKNRHDKNGVAGRRSHAEEATLCENALPWYVRGRWKNYFSIYRSISSFGGQAAEVSPQGCN